jgi:hypothetical protein
MRLNLKAIAHRTSVRMGLCAAALVVAAEIVVACSSGGSSSTTTTTTTSSGTSTASVKCSYTETTPNRSASLTITSMATWSCTSTERLLSANGIPDHSVGTFPNSGNPNTISAQTVNWYTSLSPSNSGTSSNVAPSGFALNGVKFDPGTAGTCPTGATSTSACSLIGGTGAWTLEALGQTDFDFGVDSNNAHVQPNGAYHYHGMPTGILTNNKATGTSMLLVGWAADGFPIYARWGYTTATSATSAIKVMVSSYSLKTTPDANRPSTSIFPMGTFTQDYQYVAGSGDLDQCNGRTDVTPEFPNGIYHYYITDTYPFIQRCVYGTILDQNAGG